MPADKEKGREPSERERETAFAPHKEPAPEQQGDGDPGNERPRIEHDQAAEDAADSNVDKTSGNAVSGTKASEAGRTAAETARSPAPTVHSESARRR